MGRMPAPSASRERQSANPLGQLLRAWRATRGYSQLELAMRSGFSSRHVSFIETGRTQPSRQALLTLAETLEVPLRERNHLLEAGGYAHVYRETPLAADEMRHIRGVLQFILDRHEPYGAVVLDRYSNLLMANDAATNLLGALVDPSLLAGTPNLLRTVFHPQGLRRCIVNWEDVAQHLARRAERELSHLEDDTEAAALLAELREYAGTSRTSDAPECRRTSAARAPATRRLRTSPLQHDHDAGNTAGRHASGTQDRDVFSSGRRVRGTRESSDTSAATPGVGLADAMRTTYTPAATANPTNHA